MSSYNEEDGSLVESLRCSDTSTRLNAVRKLKHAIIGNQRKKQHYAKLGVISQLSHILTDQQFTDNILLTECITTLGSFAHGTSTEISSLVIKAALSPLLNGLTHVDANIVIATLRTLRIIYQYDDVPSDVLFQNPAISQQLINLLWESSYCACCAASIITSVCKDATQQCLLNSQGIIPALLRMMSSSSEQVVCVSLNCLVKIIFKNKSTATSLLEGCVKNQPVIHLLTAIISSQCDDDTLLACANCLTCLFRVELLQDYYDVIKSKVVTTLVRICKQAELSANKVNAIFCLAYLIEECEALQCLVARSNKLINLLVKGLRDKPPHYSVTDENMMEQDEDEDDVVDERVLKLYPRSCEATLLVLRSVCDKNEVVRVQVMNTIDKEAVFDCISDALNKNIESMISLRLAAIRCLLSLSRSPVQLQTTFKDYNIWNLLQKTLRSDNTDEVIVSSAVMCNLLLPLSSVQKNLLEGEVIVELCVLVSSEVYNVRLNAVWALMNATMEADLKLKCTILDLIGIEKIIILLSQQSDESVVLKVLGLMVNLSSSKEIVDIFTAYNKQLFPVLLSYLGTGSEAIVQQILMLVNNLSDGTCETKDIIIESELLMQKLAELLQHPQTSIQLLVACVQIVKHLTRGDCHGCVHRQNCLEEEGIRIWLQKLQKIDHTVLQNLLRSTLDQFA
ncbi:armadillo repeat-containing protein 8-like isoform X2 [Dysidea avara]|uniref:armadillo repeat-containing protein 8-like isoform X2 n=1 Tax=Dysidea avara TaxID=196820 RepID=UPI003328E9FC